MSTWFANMEQVKREFKRVDSHFFDADAMRFFDSKILNKLYAGRIFVSGERPDEDVSRKYSVRIIERHPDGYLTIEPIGFHVLSSAEANTIAGVIGRWEQEGKLPDTFAYGQGPALAAALGIESGGKNDGWVFDPDHGFSKEDQPD